MDIDYFYSFKNKKENNFLDINLLKNYNLRIRKRKQHKHRINNILKNSHFQTNKNKLENKIILVLNKLSKKNLVSIIKEFIENIKIQNLNDFNIFFKTIFIKIINEIQFIDTYILFLNDIINIYKIKFNYTPKYFIDIIESNIYNFYMKKDYNDYFLWLKELNNEIFRKNNLIIIKKLIEYNILNKKIKKLISSIIINQNIYKIDVYYWFLNINLSASEKNKIKIIINEEKMFRTKTLLSSLLNKKIQKINNIINVENKKNINNVTDVENVNNVTNITNMQNQNDRNTIEYKNIYEEYLYLGILDEVNNFIKENCKIAHTKNIFCKIGLEIFFKSNNVNMDKIIDLFNKLINNKIIFKSNLSRGLLNLVNNNKKFDDEKFTKILKFLKNKFITRGIENLMKKYKLL